MNTKKIEKNIQKIFFSLEKEVQDYIKIMKIPLIIPKNTYEADDLIFSLHKKLKNNNLLIFSNDKDFIPLLSSNKNSKTKTLLITNKETIDDKKSKKNMELKLTGF